MLPVVIAYLSLGLSLGRSVGCNFTFAPKQKSNCRCLKVKYLFYAYKEQMLYLSTLKLSSLTSAPRLEDTLNIRGLLKTLTVQLMSRSVFSLILTCLVFVPAVVLASVDLLVLGDWGGMPVKPYTLPGQVATAKGMGIIGDKLKAQAVLALGDNFYTYGIQGDESSHRFKDTWDNVYTADSLTSIPWLVIAGNHDYKGNVSAQVAYSQDNARWHFPSLYHSRSFTSEDGTTVDVILIDTVDLSGATGGASPEEDPEYFAALPSRPKAAAADQWAWIEAQLAASTAQHVFVGGHYSLYSVCEHGNSQTLIDHLKPLLEQYGAHYLSGHDHCMENLVENGVHYFVSGMGDTCCYEASETDKVPEGSLLWHTSRGHKDKGTIGGFTSITATPQAATVVFYDQDGKALYTAPELPPRKLSVA